MRKFIDNPKKFQTNCKKILIKFITQIFLNLKKKKYDIVTFNGVVIIPNQIIYLIKLQISLKKWNNNLWDR